MYIHFPKNPISFTFNTFLHLVVSENVSIFAPVKRSGMTNERRPPFRRKPTRYGIPEF